jgi:hypothetical protein
MERRHTCKMATYTVTSKTDRDGFEVEIVGNDGVRQTMLGFKTHAEADAWIVEDSQRATSDDRNGFRMRWRF